MTVYTVQQLIDDLSDIEDKTQEVKVQEIGYGNPLLDLEDVIEVGISDYVILRAY
jgi:hypothetical protein